MEAEVQGMAGMATLTEKAEPMGPGAGQKQRSAWTEAVEASYRRDRRARSELTPPAGSPEPSEDGGELKSDVVVEEQAGVRLTDFSGQRLEYARPLGVQQSSVAPEELGYPSGLHRLGRLMVMAAVTSICLYRRAAPLPPIHLPPLPSLPPLDVQTFVGGVRIGVLF